MCIVKIETVKQLFSVVKKLVKEKKKFTITIRYKEESDDNQR